MQKWLRRIRGAIGMGLTWGVGWAAVGSVPRWLFGFNTDAPFPIIFGVLGFIAGVIFSGLLMLTEGRRGFDQMRLSRFAAWGAVGGVSAIGHLYQGRVAWLGRRVRDRPDVRRCWRGLRLWYRSLWPGERKCKNCQTAVGVPLRPDSSTVRSGNCVEGATYRLSRNPLPSNIAGIAFSIRAARVADCLAAAKWYR